MLTQPLQHFHVSHNRDPGRHSVREGRAARGLFSQAVAPRAFPLAPPQVLPAVRLGFRLLKGP